MFKKHILPALVGILAGLAMFVIGGQLVRVLALFR